MKDTALIVSTCPLVSAYPSTSSPLTLVPVVFFDILKTFLYSAMKRVSYLLLLSLLVTGCGSSGSNSSKQDILYEVEVTEGWQEGDSLKVQYRTGYKPEENTFEFEVDTTSNPQFSTIESIDVSLAKESSIDSTNTDICIRARVLEKDSYRLRVAVKGAGRSNEYETEELRSFDIRGACLPKEGNE
jgi:hypothetical protein